VARSHPTGINPVKLRDLTAADWPTVRRIYEEGLATGNATFETEAPPWERWDASHLAACRLVATEDETILGWAALSPVSDRCIYGGVAEVSVYVGESARGRGVGRALLDALITSSEDAGLWTLQSSLFPENQASLALHQHCGFRVVGQRERIGELHGVWRDTLLLERRSAKVRPA
jgi:L-amino acid N-acyltransferase YncA